MRNLTEEQRFAFEIYETITSLFDKESDNYKYDLYDVDFTAFFTGLLIASNMFYRKVTDENRDLLDFVAIQMRLVHQYANNPKEEE